MQAARTSAPSLAEPQEGAHGLGFPDSSCAPPEPPDTANPTQRNLGVSLAGDGVGQHLPDELWSLFSNTHHWLLLYFPCVFGIAGIREVSTSNPEQIQPESHSEGFTLTHLVSPSGGSRHPKHRGMPSTAWVYKERAVLPMQEEGSCWKLG